MFAKLFAKKPSKMASNFPSHYAVYELLGKGAFGTVMRCVKRSTGQEFAVKIINKQLSQTDLEVGFVLTFSCQCLNEHSTGRFK